MALSAFAIFAAPATATPEKLRDSPQHLRQNIFLAALILVAASVIFITVLSGTQSLGQRWLSHSLDLYGATAVDLYTRGGKPALEKYLDSIDRSARAPRRKTPAA